MKTRVHTLHLKSGCRLSGTEADCYFTTSGFGEGGTIKKGVVYVDYLTSRQQSGDFAPAGVAHLIKVKSGSIPKTDISLRCDDSGNKSVNIPDSTIGVCINMTYETSGGNSHFSYHNSNEVRDGTYGLAFENFQTSNPLNIKITDISDTAIAITNWRMGLVFVEFLEEDE